MRAKFSFTLIALTLSLAGLRAQAPVQQVVRPTGGVTNNVLNAPVAPVAVADGDATAKALLQTLLQLKAANDAILQRQAAALSQLEEMSKAAEQLKVYSSRP